MKEPNYSAYSEDELRFALANIDRKKHPDRINVIVDLLSEIEKSNQEQLQLAIDARYEGGINEASQEFRTRIRTCAKYSIAGALLIVLKLSVDYINPYLAIIGLVIDSWGKTAISAAGVVMILSAYKTAKCPVCDKYIGGNLWTTNSCRACGTEFI